MGKTKKAVEEPKEVKVEASDTSFSYTGTINVSLKKGNKTYFTKRYKNKGRWPLFTFLNRCLRGDYNNAEAFRPKYINAFGNDSWINQDPPDITDENTTEGHNIGDYFKEDYRVTVSSYPYLSLPDVWDNPYNPTLNIGESSVTYKFDIPFSQILSDKPVCAFALYAAPVTASGDQSHLTDINNPCAYFFILDEHGKVTDMLKDVRESYTDEYNLYIEWTLSISNRQ